MDDQAITTKSDLERILLDEKMEAKRLSLSLLKTITNNFSLEIGRGGFAVVYKGLLVHRDVAVKHLSQNSIDDKEFIREVQCLMKAKHKNIVRILGYCSDRQGQMVKFNEEFAMGDVCQRLLCFEYVPNGSLDKYIQDASREWEKCYKIIKGVCEGLHYLHKERIVHRDLKPANILLDNDMVPKIADFGISRCFDELQTHDFTSKLVGTLGYIAPELFHSRQINRFKSDIYSLGTIITEILTGGDKGRPEVEEVKKHWSHKLEGSQKELQLEQIRVCTEVCQSCLEYNPEDRPSAQEIIDILNQTEIEERCIEPGASSHDPRSLGVHGRDCCKSDAAADAATPLMTKRKRPRWYGPPPKKTVVLQWENENLIQGQMLMQAISKLYARDTEDMKFEKLCKVVFNLVHHNKGEELYSAAESAMASEVQSLCWALDDAAAPVDSALFLQELLTKWDRHIRALRDIRFVFMYMEITFVPINGKTPIYELGLRLWRDEMARSDKIRTRLIEAVKRQKGGEDELVPGVNKMLTELGADVKDKDNNNMPVLCFHDGTACSVV